MKTRICVALATLALLLPTIEKREIFSAIATMYVAPSRRAQSMGHANNQHQVTAHEKPSKGKGHSRRLSASDISGKTASIDSMSRRKNFLTRTRRNAGNITRALAALL
uniref:Secreted protein n=1 Tax=Rhipicephalus appendiculatus TaxID=34631 RepID=A0A131YG19_RHIAP